MNDARFEMIRAALGDDVRLAGRRRHFFSSSAVTDTLFFRDADGMRSEVLLKSSHGGEGRGSAAAIAYEAAVYAGPLRALAGLETARFIAARRDGETAWLAIERIAGAERIKNRGVPTYRRAARWLGRFHRLAADRAPELERVLRRETLAELLHAADTVHGARANRPLPRAIARALDWYRTGGAHALVELQAPAHGEFYPANVIVAGPRLCAVDWECAAIGSAERDLAMLSEGWDGAQREMLENDYARERWGCPVLSDDVRRRLEIARMQLAWIGLASHLTECAREPFPEVYLRMAASASARLGPDAALSRTSS